VKNLHKIPNTITYITFPSLTSDSWPLHFDTSQSDDTT